MKGSSAGLHECTVLYENTEQRIMTSILLCCAVKCTVITPTTALCSFKGTRSDMEHHCSQIESGILSFFVPDSNTVFAENVSPLPVSVSLIASVF